MVKMLNAISAEIDDSDAAVAEILEQLHLDRDLRKNSIGLVACNYEFIEVGTLEALGAALPFEIIGITTLGNAAQGLYGLDYLSVSVLTSDDVRFSSALTGKITGENIQKEVSGALNTAQARLGKVPSFVLAYAPMMASLGGVVFFNEINRVCGDAPVFGAFSCDQTLDFQESKVIYRGKAYADSLALILMEGDIHPKFFVTAIPDKNIQKQHAIITESDGIMLKKVNNMPLLDYLGTLGLTRGGGIEAVATIPFMVNYNDGTKSVALAMYEVTPEGFARCGGDMPVDATLAIGLLDYESIMETAESTVSQFLRYKDINGILMYPCLSRNMILGVNGSAEMKKITGLLGDRAPYQICYSGGEICPMQNAEGGYVNHFHNFTFVACIF
ncbi:MAG: FIST C-terminal domain-containing protein [Treponema sp.]|jgi:hypothetical protein|nr:FIST C-terminal domain-containing protein [Treponema sp.]